MPIPDNDAEPFEATLANNNNQIVLASAQSTVTLDGRLVTEIRYEGTDPASDLRATYGVDGAEVEFPVEIGLTHDCNGDGATDTADLNCVCQVGAVDELLAELDLTPGDFNGDGSVNFNDFLVLAMSFGQSGVGYAGGDANCSGTVDFADFLVLATNFGR